MPNAIRRRCFPAQDIEIAVVRAYLVKSILWAVPLVKHLLDHVLTILKPKSNRPFVRRPPRVAIHFQLHLPFSSLPSRAPGDKQPGSILLGWPIRRNRNN